MVLDEADKNSYMTFGGYDDSIFKATNTHRITVENSWTIDIDYLKGRDGKLIKLPWDLDLDIETYSPYITLP